LLEKKPLLENTNKAQKQSVRVGASLTRLLTLCRDGRRRRKKERARCKSFDRCVAAAKPTLPPRAICIFGSFRSLRS